MFSSRQPAHGLLTHTIVVSRSGGGSGCQSGWGEGVQPLLNLSKLFLFHGLGVSGLQPGRKDGREVGIGQNVLGSSMRDNNEGEENIKDTQHCISMKLEGSSRLVRVEN